MPSNYHVHLKIEYHSIALELSIIRHTSNILECIVPLQ